MGSPKLRDRFSAASCCHCVTWRTACAKELTTTVGRLLPKRLRSGVGSGSSDGFQRPTTIRLWGRCERTRWQTLRAWEKANGGSAQTKITVFGSLARESRISSETGGGRYSV